MSKDIKDAKAVVPQIPASIKFLQPNRNVRLTFAMIQVDRIEKESMSGYQTGTFLCQEHMPGYI